jgi:hypothetical protein
MNIIEAKKAYDNYKKIKMKSWGDGEFLSRNGNGGIANQGTYSQRNYFDCDFINGEWEVVKEKVAMKDMKPGTKFVANGHTWYRIEGYPSGNAIRTDNIVGLFYVTDTFEILQ